MRVAPIRWRLVAWAMLVFGLLLILVGAAVYGTMAHAPSQLADQALATQGDLGADSAREAADGGYRAAPGGFQGGRFYLLVASDGRVTANPQQVTLARLPALPTPRRLPAYATIQLAGEPVRLYLRPAPPAGPAGDLLVVGQSLEPQEQALHRLLLVLLAVGGGGLACALAGAWFLAGRALVPIERAFARQQRFVADASHELRTPLAILDAAAELLEQRRDDGAPAPLPGDLRRETAHLERLTDDLLTLARSDLDELGLAVGTVDLRLVVATVAQRAAALAQRRTVELVATPSPAELLVEADPDRLEQVLLILLDNALKHTPRGRAHRGDGAPGGALGDGGRALDRRGG